MYIGTDPEFPILDPHKEPVPAWKFFPDKGNKLIPFEGAGLFRDGFNLEINTPPAKHWQILASSVSRALKEARRLLPDGYTLSSIPTVKVDLDKILMEAPMDAMVFGCEPSWNAYTDAFESIELDATEHPFRYAGGHMHIAWKHKTVRQSGSRYAWLMNPTRVMLFVKLLDQYVGYPLSVWFNKPETFARRKYYGQAGDFRFQTYDGNWYGVEYRTPGPELWNNALVAKFAFGAMCAVARQFERLAITFDHGLSRDIRQAINEGVGDAELLEKCYIPVDGTQPQFVELVKHQRPFQHLLEVMA